MMEITKSVDKNYEISRVDKNYLKENQFYLAGLWRIIFARLTDLIISSLLFLILGFIFKNKANEGNWVFLFVIFSTALIWNFSYFVLLTYLLKGKTVGKIIFKIKLVKLKLNQKIKFMDIFSRELLFVIAPWCLLYVGNMLFLFLMMKYEQTSKDIYLSSGYVIYQVNYWIFLIWNIAIALSIKMQKNHQDSIDIKHQILVVLEKPKALKIKHKLVRKFVLKETPGKFDKDVLDVIGNSDEKEFYKSIYVEKPNLSENLKLEKSNQKQIESKDRGKNHE